MAYDKPAVIAETGKGPRVRHTPLRCVHRVLVVEEGLDYTVVEDPLLAGLVVLQRLSEWLTRQTSLGVKEDPWVWAWGEEELVVETVEPHAPNPVGVLPGCGEGLWGLPRIPNTYASIVTTTGKKVLFIWIEV